MTNKPASFTLRLLAYASEWFYLVLLNMIFILIVVSQPTLSAALVVFLVYLIIFVLNPLIIYNSIVLTRYFGGSLGKLFTGLQVTNENGAPLTPKRIAFRQTIGYSFSSLVFGLGFFSIAKDPKKQGWHDKTVGSLVVIKHNLWPLAIIVCLIAIAGSIYLGMLSWERVTQGPLHTETEILQDKMNADLKKAATVTKEVKLSPTPTPIAYPTFIQLGPNPK
jgi:uncharacterized RDD family membrane protein YckC